MRLALAIILCLTIQSARPRLLVLGDSLTVGLAATSETTTYKAVLAHALDADLGSAYARNLEAAEGATIGWQPDVIVLEIGLNDVLSPTLEEAAWPARYGALLDRLQGTGATIIAATPFHGLYQGHPRYAAMARYAAYIREEAGARGIAVADLWALDGCVPACLSQPSDPSPFPPLFAGDNFHPNDEGHRRIALTILRALRPYTVYIPEASYGNN